MKPCLSDKPAHFNAELDITKARDKQVPNKLHDHVSVSVNCEAQRQEDCGKKLKAAHVLL